MVETAPCLSLLPICTTSASTKRLGWPDSSDATATSTRLPLLTSSAGGKLCPATRRPPEDAALGRLMSKREERNTSDGREGGGAGGMQ